MCLFYLQWFLRAAPPLTRLSIPPSHAFPSGILASSSQVAAPDASSLSQVSSFARPSFTLQHSNGLTGRVHLVWSSLTSTPPHSPSGSHTSSRPRCASSTSTPHSCRSSWMRYLHSEYVHECLCARACLCLFAGAHACVLLHVCACVCMCAQEGVGTASQYFLQIYLPASCFACFSSGDCLQGPAPPAPLFRA